MRRAPNGVIFLPVLAPLLCLIGAIALDVRLEESRGLSEPDRAEVTAQIRARAAARGAQGVIVVRALALPGALRVTLSQPEVGKSAQASLSGAPDTWAPAIDAALEALGWAAPAPDVPAVATGSAAAAIPLTAGAAPPPDGGPSILGLSLVGGAVAAGAAAVVLGAMNAAARDEGNPLPVGSERDALEERATVTGLGANVLFGVAGAALIAGVWILVAD